MEEVFEALLELNKQMLLWGMASDYCLELSEDDFYKLASFMNTKFKRAIVIEETNYKNWKEYKVAGPGGYITVKKRLNDVP